MNDLQQGVWAELDRRNLNASGAMRTSVAVNTAQSATETVGTMTALDYWINVGSGTPPGTTVDIHSIAQWIEIRQLSFEPQYLKKRIEEDGSKDFQAGNPNAFDTAIEQWRNSARVLAIPDIVLEAYGKATLEIISQLSSASKQTAPRLFA